MRHYKIILKIFQINRIDERKYKVMHAAKKKKFFFFYFSVDNTQDSSSDFVYSTAPHFLQFLKSFLFCSVCT